QVKNARETRASELVLVPGTVRQLGANQEVDAAPHGRLKRATRGNQAERSPRRLRGRRLPDALERRIVVTATGLAPCSGWLLGAFEPVGRFPDCRMIRRQKEGVQPLQDLPGPVDIVDPPATVPATLHFLGPPKIIEGTPY